MGTYDISRINFDAKKHYSSVRMQQGRVLTDDDWNEDNRIHEEELRRSRIDIIGPYGSPHDGFEIRNPHISPAGLIDFNIEAGTLHLGGLQIELEERETYRLQKDWLQQPDNLDMTPPRNRVDLVYIEAWQQAVSAVEDESLFEVALGGPDTTTRLRTMRRVHIASVSNKDCAMAWNELCDTWKNIDKNEYEQKTNVLLSVSFNPSGLPEDLCTPNAAGGYLGAENQAIRVQIVDKGYFTWGFDNASPLYRVTVAADGRTVHMLTEPKDQYHRPLSNQVVEILPWSAILPNGEKVAEQTGHLSKVDISYDSDSGNLRLSSQIPLTPLRFGSAWKSRSDIGSASEYFYMRVWDRGNDLSSPAKILFTPGAPVALGHTGLNIRITGTDIVASDYWVIAARPETPHRVVPWELEQGISPHGIPPHGVRRFFAPLAIIQWKDGILEQVHDCRKKFKPLTDLECDCTYSGCCSYSVGNGGDYSTIQGAISALPAAGGKICILPGTHIVSNTITIRDRRDPCKILISGCGDQSIVQLDSSNPIFNIENSHNIKIEQLTLIAPNGTAIEILNGKNVTIKENRIRAEIQAIRISEVSGISKGVDISYNEIDMINTNRGKPAIFSIADDVLIERNRIVVVDQNGIQIPYNPLVVYQAMGGIQIGGTSERVHIKNNEIIGGKGNGITLGHLNEAGTNSQITFMPKQYDYSGHTYSAVTYSSLYEISIEENQILQMGLSGISTLQNMVAPYTPNFVYVNDITLYRNNIKYCARQLGNIQVSALNYCVFGGIILSNCEDCRIHENRVENNGVDQNKAVCGIFILYGEKIYISTNCIANNGKADNVLTYEILSGTRGGIVIMMSATLPFAGILANAGPAVKVHNNIVDQPLGHALFLMAFGPVSVVGNQFNSFDTDKGNTFSGFAATTFIFNLGVSKDLQIAGFRNLAHPNEIVPIRPEQASEFQFLPSGKVMFSDNQTTLDLRSQLLRGSTSSQLIVSLDDISFNSNQSECVPGVNSFNPISFNTILWGVSIRSNDNRFSDGIELPAYSLLSYGLMNTAVGNQATHCMIVLGSMRAINNNIIVNAALCPTELQTNLAPIRLETINTSIKQQLLLGIQNLKQLIIIKQQVFGGEKARLIAKYSTAHPTVQKIALQLVYYSNILSVLVIEIRNLER